MSLSLLNFKNFTDTKVKNALTNFIYSLEDHLKNSNIHCSTYIQSFLDDSFKNIFKDVKDEGIILTSMLNENDSKEAAEYIKNTFNDSMKVANNIYEKKMHECELDHFRKYPTYMSDSYRRYDTVMTGNVNINKIKTVYESTHKITFNKINKILIYQVHENKNEIISLTHLPEHPDNKDTNNHPQNTSEVSEYIQNNPEKVVNATFNLNENRNIKLLGIDDFILYFNNTSNFKPTTIMEIGFKKYPFVINKVKKINNKMVFYISTKEIKLLGKYSNNLIKKIPTGIYKRVRFDIDDYELYGNSIGDCHEYAPAPNSGPELTEGRCFCPVGSKITTLGAVEGKTRVDICRKNCGQDYPYLTGGVCYSGCNRSDDDYAVGPCCWRHKYVYDGLGTYWGDWPWSPYCKSSYVPDSFRWVENPSSYFCYKDKVNEAQTICGTPMGQYRSDNICKIKIDPGNPDAICCPPGIQC
jgi:hypothetical protein